MNVKLKTPETVVNRLAAGVSNSQNLKGPVETTDGHGAAKRRRHERGFVSRSTVATKDARDFSTAWFQAELLRVTDLRSHELAQLAEAFTDSSK
jgi:hypothetical protein